jgi:hypothetical protein
MYQQSSGAHVWFNAPSGTAGTTITWTQAMTLDTSGYLTLGPAPSINRIFGSSGNPLYGLVDNVIQISTSTDTVNHRVGITFSPAQRTGSGIFCNNVSATSGNEDSNLEFYVSKEGNLNATLAGQFDASGRLLVGTTSALINESSMSVVSSGNTCTFKTTGGTGTQPILCWNSGSSGTRELIALGAGSSWGKPRHYFKQRKRNHLWWHI